MSESVKMKSQVMHNQKILNFYVIKFK